GGAVVISANAARTRGDKAAADWMDLSGSLSVNAVLGRSVAVAVLCCGDCGLGLVVSRRGGGLWISRCFDCTERVRTESAESSSGDSRPHGYAAGVPHFSDRLSYLAENSKTGSLETAGSILDLRFAHRGDVDQGADCLCVSAARDRPVRVVAAKE